MKISNEDSDAAAGVKISGPSRRIDHKGRSGIQALSVHTRLEFVGAGERINIERGALTFWVMPLEDLSNATYWGHFKELEPDFHLYTLLSDQRDLRDIGTAHFALLWQTNWWRPLMARFIAGNSTIPSMNKPSFGPCDFRLHALCWYQIGVTWDRPDGRFDLFVNGIQVGTANRGYPQTSEKAGEDLFAGNPCFVLGELRFFEKFWNPQDFEKAYAETNTHPEPELIRELETEHGGRHFETASWSPDSEWSCELSLPLNRPEDLEHFYIQGNKNAVRVTPDGLLVETPKIVPPPLLAPDNDDRVQVYLHTWQTFEGDVALEFDFQPMQDHGLALVMIHASGMQREDFMKDYPLREVGSMRMVCWENVRNYHWEFWRCMEGIRCDTATHAFFKNPWFRGLAYRAMPERMPLNEWHRIQLVQEGARFRGIVDGVLVFDVLDHAFQNHGPVFNFGHISLRNMWNSRCLWSNLRVHVRKPPYSRFSDSRQALSTKA